MKIKLKDGRELSVDLYLVTVSDVREILESKKEKADPYGKEDNAISRAVGLTIDELRTLPYPDYRKVINAFWKSARDPLEDNGDEKNSQSVSISE